MKITQLLRKMAGLSLLCLFILISSLPLTAQVPQGLNYQAIARNASGDVLQNTAIGVRFTITDATSAPVYQETHALNTNQFGLFTAVIGSGTVVSGVFSNIGWETGPHYLRVEFDPDGNAYQLMGLSQFQSVPYALTAGTALNSGSLWTESGSSIYYDAGNVGVGTSTPSSLAAMHIDNGKLLVGAAGGILPARLVVNASTNEEILRGRLNGTSVFSIEGNGDFGIGTVSPLGRLDIRKGSNRLFLVDSNGLVGVGTSSPIGRLHVDVGGNPALFVNNSTGWVGLGTTAPGTNLDVAFNTSATSNGIRINQQGTGDAVLRFALSNSTKYTMGIDQSDNEYFKISKGFGLTTNTVITIKDNDVEFADNISADYVYANRHIIAAGGRIDLGDIYLMYGGSKLLYTDADIRPAVHNSDDLGTSGFRFSRIYLVNSPNVSSDQRLKKDIRNLDYGLEEVLKLRPVSYKWKEGPDQQDKIGLIAQELQEVISEVVSNQELLRNPDSGEKQWTPTQTLGVTYEGLIPVLIKAIQEQQELINALEERIGHLESGAGGGLRD